MKLILKYSLFIVLVFAIASCKQKSECEIPPLVIEIPDELNEQHELVDFIRSAEKSFNCFSASIEHACIENPNLWEKEAEEMTIVEKLKVLRLAGEMAVAYREFSKNYVQMNKKMEQFENQMNPKQLLALAMVGEAFENRMELLKKRLEKIGVN